jgi:hypothetical protein
MCHNDRNYDASEDNKAAVCNGKIALTYEVARAILKKPTNKGKRRVGYLCPACRHWHIGRPSKGGLRTPKGVKHE